MSGKRGLKVKLTESARKRRKKDANLKFNKFKVNIGDQYERWIALRD